MSFLYDFFDLFIFIFNSDFYDNCILPLLCFSLISVCLWFAHRLIEFKSR